MGLRQDDSAAFLIENTGIDMTVDELVSERNKKHVERFPFAKPMPGAMRLVKHLKAHNIPMVVATSSHRSNFTIKASNNQDLFSMFDSITCGDDPGVNNGKPAPDLFLVAREKLGNPPVKQCLVFEDAINGVQAARNAGMQVIWVPDPNVAALCPGDNGASEVIFSLDNFVPEKYGLPPYSD
ncbi:627_t:CDS:2 [Acaulospora colombiana]|uniref:627_t:CDS:1 n=1 Tax=Acaulospora colombiana TaxID=27376 RepID=A0ACA9M320_9GLOM|nr:627_t:CDS:2 [Acaulospora colombiana]